MKIEKRRSGDLAELIGSAEKAHRLLGWQPKFDLEEIVRTAWQWHKKLTNE